MSDFSALDFVKEAQGEMAPRERRPLTPEQKKMIGTGAAGLAAGAMAGKAVGARGMYKHLSDPHNLNRHVLNVTGGKGAWIRRGRPELHLNVIRRIKGIKGKG